MSFMLSVTIKPIMLGAFMLSVVMLNVVAPRARLLLFERHYDNTYNGFTFNNYAYNNNLQYILQ